MALFQRAPATAEEMEASRPLDLSPDEVNELGEEAWYEKAYRGEAPQLTLRAVGTGAVLGLLLAATNLYLGLKTGLHIGMGLTACALSFFAWSVLVKARWARTPMTILENNCMVSTASAASFATGNTLTSAIPALLLLSGAPLPWHVTALWVLLLAVLGTCLAVPMKRSLVDRERLRFPSGTAVAGLLRSFHSEGARALAQARGLLFAAAVAGVVPLLKDLHLTKRLGADGKLAPAGLLPPALKVFDWLPGVAAGGAVHPLSAFKIQLDYSPALLAAGALIGVRVAVSMVAGALLQVFVLGPKALGWVGPDGVAFAAAAGPGTVGREIGVWVGAPVLVSSSLFALAFQWRSVVGAVQILRAAVSPDREGRASSTSRAAVEVPATWFVMGAALSGLGVVLLAWRWFGVPIPYGVLAVLLTFLFSLVVCRVTGETDFTPTGAMGKIMQVAYAPLVPRNAAANLMTAGITAGASAAAADLLTDLKAGRLLGADPRRQFVAQLLGVLPGTAAAVFCYQVLIPDAASISGAHPAFPVPGAQPWFAVAKVLEDGLVHLHPMAQQGIVWGCAAGAVLAVLERALPGYKKYLPSATGLGLGLFLAPSLSLAICLGACVAAFASRDKNSRTAEMVLPVASGLIAGEALVGVVVAAVNAALR